MKASLNGNLNIRSIKPEVLVDNNALGFKPGDDIQISETIIGEEFNGNKIWYKLEDGNYAWSGGVDGTFPLNSNSSLFDSWNITEVWKKTMGEGIKVAVIEAGFDFENPSIKNNNHQQKGNSNNQSHGTYMASIIGGSDYKNCYMGLAPKAEYIYYSLGDINSLTPENLLNCLQNLGEVDIINMSFTIDKSSFFPSKTKAKQIEATILNMVTNNNTVFVAAAGNDGSNMKIKFPALYKNVISVSGFGENKEWIHEDSNIWDNVSLVSPFQGYFDKPAINIKGYFNIPIHEGLNGTSSATAFSSGVFTLLKSWVLKNEGKKINAQEIKNRIFTEIVVTPLNENLKTNRYNTHFIDVTKFQNQL